MKKHFVTFYSPGTFFAEDETREIESWDIEKAKEISRSILARYNQKPYAFQFTTRERGEEDFNSKETARSGTYYLGGKVETLAEVKARATERDSILLSNMRCNKWDRLVTVNNSSPCSQPLRDGDVVLEY